MARRLFALFRTAIFAGVVVSMAVWFIPRWFHGGTLPPPANQAGYPVMLIAALILYRCFWDFAWRGLGTPAIFDPPRRLVVTGLYRWVRNPMYAGMVLLVIGEAILYADIRRQMLWLAAIFWLAATIFVWIYEEPVLREKFGTDYVAYCAAVRRWIPRLKPFDNSSAATIQ